MDSSLSDLLKKCSTGETKEPTHFTCFGPSKQWTISDDKYEEFWKEYCEIAEYPETNSANLGLAEVNGKHMPVIADFNFKYHQDKDMDIENLYNNDFILAIVQCYQKVLEQTFKLSQNKQELLCCVLKSDPHVEGGIVLAKIRLQFSYCKTLAQIQNRIIRPVVLQMFRTKNVIAKLPCQPLNDWEDILDPTVVEKPVTMYGSTQYAGQSKLVLENILKVIKDEDIEEGNFPLMEIHEAFFLSNHQHASGGLVDVKFLCNETGELNYDLALPYFLSIHYVKEIVIPRTTTLPTSNNNSMLTSGFKASSVNIKVTNSSGDSEDEDEESPQHLAGVFLDMLSKKRSKEEHFWIDVGRALHNIYDGDEEGLEKWTKFTLSGGEFSEEDCVKWYSGFMGNKIGIKTLAYYAREDSPEEYAIWHERWYQPAIEEASSCTHADVAAALYKVYWLEIAASDLSKNSVYYFKNHIWVKMNSGHTLKQLISGEFLKIVERFRTRVVLQTEKSQDKNYKDSCEILIQKLSKLIDKLKNRSYKNLIFSECIEKFYVESFESYLDIDPDLMGCINGILQCTDKKVIFRDGKPEDYVSKTTGVKFPKHFTDKSPEVINLMNYLNKVFPDGELLKYFGKITAAALRGRNAEKIFPIHTGGGNNSKSMIKKLLENTFGDYCVTFPTAIFTSPKSSGGPDPSVARSKYAHIAYVQEPDSETPFKVGTLKEYTGGDRFFARFLQDNGGEFVPMFTLNLMCNLIPAFTDIGEAVRNRTRILPYLSTWTKTPPKDPEEQYKQKKFLLDPNFENQLPGMGPAMLWWLAYRMFPLYKKEGADVPEIVRQHTQQYWEDNDYFSEFIKENLEKAYKSDKEGVLDEKAFISLADMYKRFKSWYMEIYKTRVPERSVFKTEMEKRVTKCVTRNFYGIKFKVEVMLEG